MKTFALVAAVLPAIWATALPLAAHAGTPQPAPAVQPAVPGVTPAACPTIPDNSATSPAMQRLFTTITDACLLKASGLIDDSQFTLIRDQAFNSLVSQMQMDDAQMQADANARLAKSLASN